MVQLVIREGADEERRDLVRMVVFVGRHARQSWRDLEELGMPEFLEHFEELVKLIKIENRKTTDEPEEEVDPEE